MIRTSQFQTQNILAHGLSVNKWFEDIIQWLVFDKHLQFNWRLHNSLLINKEKFRETFLTSLSKVFENASFDSAYHSLQRYIIFHDCGKTLCALNDENGKHFPNHEKISSDVWSSIGGSLIEAKLMSMDMIVHTMKAIDVENFKKINEAPILMLVGLCELHSNAEMFGGFESESFKIKLSRLNARWKKCFN
jgi:hypothetical protein